MRQEENHCGADHQEPVFGVTCGLYLSAWTQWEDLIKLANRSLYYWACQMQCGPRAWGYSDRTAA